MKPTLPPTIFKYEPLTLQSLKNFKARSVFFASPLKFNDPYDCAINADVADPSDEDLEEIRRNYMSRPDIPDAARNQFGSMLTTGLKEILVRNMKQNIDVHREDFLKNKGVCCFTETNSDLLMWSHYGACYQGICLEFRTEYPPFNNIHKVRYEDKMPMIDLRGVSVERDASQLIESLFCTKAKSWAYEREWRAFHAKADTLYTYPAEALKAVYFGPNIDPLMRDIVCTILAGQNPKVELWIGSRSRTDFKVEFELKTYTPYIVAKEAGLL